MYWTVVGAAFTWIVVMALVQKGVGGYLLAFGLIYAALAVVGAMVFARHVGRQFTLQLLGIGLLVGWWFVGGTYSWRRDAILTLVVTLIVLLVFPSSRRWLANLPRRIKARKQLWQRKRRKRQSPTYIAASAATGQRIKAKLAAGTHAFFSGITNRKSGGGRKGGLPHTYRHQARRPRGSPRLQSGVVFLAAVMVWVSLSFVDSWFESAALPRSGTVLRPPAMPSSYAELRVGLAMSGGGYRAALVHAGVVEALGQMGIPVTHLSSVSGGSILGSYLSVGGSPQAFRDAVAAGRFRMLRDLLATPNLVRLPSSTVLPGLDVDLWPFFDEFSRVDVQANLIDRVLLDGALPSERNGPRLMVCMTDLIHGLSVGATDDGILLSGPVVARFFRHGEAIDFEGLPRLADRVAVSGAFPMAFPAVPVQARIAIAPALEAEGDHRVVLELRLADGGGERQPRSITA